jgi:tRNA dimethylallyltransferase
VRILTGDLEARGDWEAGLRLLTEKDPVRAGKLFANDWYRLGRYLEIVLSLERDLTASSSKTTTTLTGERVRPLQGMDIRGVFVSEDREQLYHTIDARCLEMVRAGLLEEVTALLLRGCLPPDFIGAKSIGYRQTIEYLVAEREDGSLAAFTEFLKDFAASTRNYARRQLQWFRRDPAFLWVRIDRGSGSSDAAAEPYRQVADEVLHWLSAPREEFDAIVAKQIADKGASVRTMAGTPI